MSRIEELEKELYLVKRQAEHLLYILCQNIQPDYESIAWSDDVKSAEIELTELVRPEASGHFLMLRPFTDKGVPE